MIAFGRDAKKWARRLGAPSSVVSRTTLYRETFTSGEHDHRATVRAFDATGRCLWSRGKVPYRECGTGQHFPLTSAEAA